MLDKLKRNASLVGVLLVLALYCCQTVKAEEISPKQWLEKMSSAMQKLNYQGVFIFRRSEELAAMKVTHVVDEQGASELLETLTGGVRRELRKSPVDLVADDEALSSSQLSQIESFYELELLGNDRTAGRLTQMISVTPKDKFRYGYRLWLDQETGLLLKSDLLGVDGEILEQVMFTSLELLAPEISAELIPKEDAHKHQTTQSTNQTGTLHWIAENLPAGFEMLKSQPVEQHGATEHMVYSDGLASVSVFVERTKPGGQSFVGLSRMGAVNAFGSVAGNYQVTVVGEVPEITVKTIGQSIKQKGPAQ